MAWRNSHSVYGEGSDDDDYEEDPYARAYGGNRTLTQSLLATAKKWETERER